MTHPHLTFDEQPELRRPYMVLAWAGWNDAGESASHAARYLAATLDAEVFASIDPEDYYDFTEARPVARYHGGQREIIWPSTDFYYARTQTDHDLIIGLGIEPNHRWKSYMSAVLDVIQTMGVERIFTLGAVAAAVPHTRPVGVRGSANQEALAEHYDMRPSRYEGPSGIVGVFHDYCRQHDVEGLSLWASVPHYLPGVTNPLGARALLEKVEQLTGLTLDYQHLSRETDRFDKQIEAALQENDKLASYVGQLEEAFGEVGQDAAEREAPSELPSAEGLIEELEDFLRGGRDDA